MTSKLTRERIELIANFHRAMTLPPSHDEIEELARMALYAMDSEPVAEVLSSRPGNDTSTIDRALPVGTTLYRHAQQPVVPAEWTIADAVKFCVETGRQDAGAAMDAWNACRAAMLQAGNSPVIPNGYVMVPKEPTERMVIDGFESEPDETFSEPEVWEAYQKMSGCEQAAYRVRLCWAAMLTAAPQEVK